ncbi:MAG TPA: iron-sulfur cluster carrier protein ApbC [Pseudomonadales bacterium]
MAVSRESVLAALATFHDPYCDEQDLVARKAVKNVVIDGGKVSVDIALGYPAAGIREQLVQQLREQILSLDGVSEAVVNLEWGIVAAMTQNNMRSMNQVKNIIAVASGKGGVGKSTTSVNLALALAAEGARVGLLDADIYGPSQPLMLGIPEQQRPEFVDEKHFRPIVAHGIESMSMGYMVTDSTPMVWRGPMVSGALQQLLTQCLWGELDYLVVDMPPGTGDIQLTLAQRVPVTGAVIVTTPQDIATLDAKKGIEMFRKVNIPVLGVVENMATHICSQCGHEEHLFGEGGGRRIAEQYQTRLLGALPLDIHIREQTDNGRPTVVAEPDGPIAAIYRDIARKTAAVLAMRGRNTANDTIDIVMTDD